MTPLWGEVIEIESDNIPDLDYCLSSNGIMVAVNSQHRLVVGSTHAHVTKTTTSEEDDVYDIHDNHVSSERIGILLQKAKEIFKLKNEKVYSASCVSLVSCVCFYSVYVIMVCDTVCVILRV